MDQIHLISPPLSISFSLLAWGSAWSHSLCCLTSILGCGTGIKWQQRHLTFLSSHEDNALLWNPELNPVASASHKFADIWSVITSELILTGLARATSPTKMYYLLFKTWGIFEFLKIVFSHCKTVSFFSFSPGFYLGINWTILVNVRKKIAWTMHPTWKVSAQTISLAKL